MRKKPSLSRYMLLSAAVALPVGCSFDADLPSRTGGTAPSNTAITVSGAGARDADAGVGAISRITDIRMESGNSHAGAPSGGAESGAASVAGGGSNTGGATSKGGGGVTSKGGGGATSKGGAAGAGSAGAGSGGSTGNPSTGGFANDATVDPPTLWFSEYLEGSSSNKALEITTLARSVLDGCKVSTYFNGKLEATVIASLSGTLEAGQTLTLCTSMLKEKLPDTCNQVGNLTFNGDDTIAISCNGTLLDVIGQIGVDPGEGWGNELNGTANHTLRRNCTIRAGDPLGTDAFDPNLEWKSFPVDSFDGLGSRGC